MAFTEEQLSAMRGGLTAEEYRLKLSLITRHRGQMHSTYCSRQRQTPRWSHAGGS